MTLYIAANRVRTRTTVQEGCMKSNHTTSASKTTTLVLLLGIALLMTVPLSATAQDEGTVIRDLPASVNCEDGATFTVSLTVTPISGTSAYFVDEDVPAGVTVDEGSISDGGTLEEQSIKWVILNGQDLVMSYDVTVPTGTPEETLLNFTGDFRFHSGMDDRDDISGDTTVECANLCPNGPQGTFHTHDADQDGIMNDDDLFDLIDAWRLSQGGELDDLLFAGIDAWKLSPSSYC